MKIKISFTLAGLALVVLVLPSIAQQPGGMPRGGRGEGMRFMTLPPLVRALDLNNDGMLDADELAKAPESLRKLDSNRDGKLTQEEYLPQFRSQGAPGGPGGGGPERNGGMGVGAGIGQPGGRGGEAASFSANTLAKDDVEKRILQALDEMSRNQRRGNMTVPEQDGRILRLLTEALGAKQVVEIGTSIGYSGTWFCLGLQKTGGKLTTFEIDAKRAAQARGNFKRAGVDNLVTLVEGDAHVEVAKLEGPIDLLFLDADKEGYLDYLKKLTPKVRPGGMVIAHNMNERQADPAFTKAITTDANLETIFLNMETSGIAVSIKKR